MKVEREEPPLSATNKTGMKPTIIRRSARRFCLFNRRRQVAAVLGADFFFLSLSFVLFLFPEAVIGCVFSFLNGCHDWIALGPSARAFFPPFQKPRAVSFPRHLDRNRPLEKEKLPSPSYLALSSDDRSVCLQKCKPEPREISQKHTHTHTHK